MLLIVDLFCIFLQLLYDYAVAFVRLFYRGPPKSLENQVVLITGAGSGLGRLLSIRLAKLGAKIVGWDVNETGLVETQKLINSELGCEGDSKAFSFECIDITDRERVYKTAAQMEETVDILINNAGIVTRNKFLCDKDDAGVVKTFEVNVFSHFWTLKAFLPGMMKQNRGHVVTVASVAGYGGSPRLSDYCASKFAVVGLHESLQFELRGQGFKDSITATLVCPYLINTGMFAGVTKNKIDFIMPILDPDYVADRIVSGILYNEKVVVIPKFCNVVAALKFLVPTEGWAKMIESLGVDTLFKNLIGRHKPEPE